MVWLLFKDSVYSNTDFIPSQRAFSEAYDYTLYVITYCLIEYMCVCGLNTSNDIKYIYHFSCTIILPMVMEYLKYNITVCMICKL